MPDDQTVGERIDLLTQAIGALTDAVGRQTPLIADIHKACTADRPASPLLEPIKQLVASVQETKEVLGDLVYAFEAQPEGVRQVVREELDRKDDE
jgi:hypothetical protein